MSFHGNRWNEDPIGYRITVKGPPKDRFMRKKSQLHLDLEAGRIEAIITVGMGMNNRKEITSKMNQKHLQKLKKKLSKTLGMNQCKRNSRHLHQHWQK